MKKLAGKRAVVTGAGKGMGRTFAHALAKEGCDIAAFSRSVDDLADLERELAPYGVRTICVAGDVARESAIEQLAKCVGEAFGGADILVNNAGISIPAPAIKQSLADWDKVLAVNLTGSFLCAKAFAPGMIERGYGRIVNISSVAGIIAVGNHAAYAASKAGLHALTRELALEWGPHGITVNAIAPTVVMTPMGERVWGPPEKSDPLRAQIPIDRFLQPEEVAAALLYLVSDEAAVVNGHIMVLDGGLSIR